MKNVRINLLKRITCSGMVISTFSIGVWLAFGCSWLGARYEFLNQAVIDNSLIKVKVALWLGADVNGNDYVATACAFEPNIPVMTAVCTHHHLVLEELLKHGANPNFLLADGVSPLGYAIQSNDFKSLELLVQYGADPRLETVSEIKTELR